MSTFDEGANQSTGEEVITETTDTAAAAPATTQDTPVEGIRVKYNKEERIIPNEEAPNWIQKGLNYDKLQERSTLLESQAKNLERVAKLYNFPDVDSYMTALDQYERDQQIAAEAEKLGVDESVIIEHLAPLKAKLSEYETQMVSIREKEAGLRIEQEIADLKTRFPDFDKYKDKAFELAIADGYKLEDAYRLASYDDKMSSISKQTEADTIRKLQGNADSTPGALGAEGAEHQTGFAAMSKADQRKFIEDVKAGRRNSF